MSGNVDEWVGGAWLVAAYGFELVAPLPIVSRIGGRRATQTVDGTLIETYVESMRADAHLRGHLTFHLKHEVTHFELLSRLFEKCNPQELETWIADEPTSRYARRACFLYEFFSGHKLPISVAVGGSYVDVIDAQKLVTASEDRAIPNRRWKVRDNLPGTRDFCPMIRKTEDVMRSMTLDIPALIHGLVEEFGEALLLRSAVWITLRESRASFLIEGEADQSDRIQRFADALARRVGEGACPLDQASLAELQCAILGKRTTVRQLGIRQSPVFVGEVAHHQETVHYVAPPSEDVAAMLDGLKVFLERTQGQSAVMRSAVAAFGFVYIHPLADGNGRVHRFLINDVLRRDGVLKDPMILPISSLISGDRAERQAYDRILDEISRPFMSSVSGLYQFSSTPTAYPDGVTSNFVFRGADHARHTWRTLNLTRHVIYLARVLERTIRENMRAESKYMRSHALARAAIKDIIEMPDVQADRVIRSAQANCGKLSHALAKEIPALSEEGVWEAMLQAVETTFKNGEA